MCSNIIIAVIVFAVLGFFFPLAAPLAIVVGVLGFFALFSDWHKWSWLDSAPKLKKLLHDIFD